ncbi:MAG: O-antigen ligase family protein [Candidatus Sericytochromatia bacterium]|nr:O-antigen ligase family protein [Candidatus Tanganyikabacteria bacterium]
MVLSALWLAPLSPVIALLLFLCSFAVRAPARAASLLGRASAWWWLWLGGVVLGAFLAPQPDVAGAGAAAVACFVLVVAAVSRALPGAAGVARGLAALCWGTVPWAVLGIAFAVAGKQWQWNWGALQIHLGTWDNRANSVFLHPNFLAGYLVLAIAASFAFRSRRLLFGAGVLPLVACLVLTQSRAGLLGTLAAVATLAAISRHPAYRAHVPGRPAGSRLRTLWPWALGSLLAVAAAPAVLRRLGDLLDPSDQSTMGRVYAWGAAWQMIAARPVFGWGPGGWAQAYPAFRDPAEHEGLVHAHSLFLHLGVEIGLLPTALFAAAIVVTAISALRAAAGNADAARLACALAAGLIGYLTLGLFDVVATEGRNALAFAAVLGMLAALPRGGEWEPERTVGRREEEVVSAAPAAQGNG